MLFTEECDKVRDLMHVHSFSYDFHLRVVHQYLVGSHMTLRQGYQLTDFLDDFISHHPDIPKFGRNHIFQGDSAWDFFTFSHHLCRHSPQNLTSPSNLGFSGIIRLDVLMTSPRWH